MSVTKYKTDEWVNYRAITKEYGLTIPALKNIFIEEGLLEGKNLSPMAQENGIGIKETVSSKFGQDERILWNVPVINQILGKRNLALLVGNERFFLAENFSQITDTIAYLGRSLLRFLKFSTAPAEEIVPYPKWVVEKLGSSQMDLVERAVSGLQEAIYENIQYFYVENQKEFKGLLFNNFFFALELTKSYPSNDHDKMRLMFFNRLYCFLGEWATDEKITQHHRQPTKQMVVNI